MSKPKTKKKSAAPAHSPLAGFAPDRKPLRLEWIDPATLTDNPANWRMHPDAQLSAIEAVLEDPDIGWAGVLLFNERTGRLLDGHARKDKWVSKHPGTPAPVVIGSWSEEAEAKILLTLDPIGAMAQANARQLEALSASVKFDDARLAGLKDQLAATLKSALAAMKPADAPAQNGSSTGSQASLTDRYLIIVTCKDEAQQTELLDRFEQEGLDCQAKVA